MAISNAAEFRNPRGNSMGMFDYVHCEVPLPDGYAGEFQTKGFDCFLSTILIRADGRLMIEDCDWKEVPLEERPNPNFPMLGALRAINKRWRDLNFHGDFSFYGSREPGERHEYLARFTHGDLEGIVAIPESFYAQYNVWAGRKRVLDVEVLADSAHADRITDETQSKPTLGRSLDDLLVELPEGRRRRVKEQVSALIHEETARLASELED